MAAGVQKIEMGFDQESRRIMKNLTRALERQQPPMTFNQHNAECKREHTHYDDETMMKVNLAIDHELRTSTRDADDIHGRVTDMVWALQNAGILFRERQPDDSNPT
jgi:hypothetical protein